MRKMVTVSSVFVALLWASVSVPASADDGLDSLAGDYVRLALRVGEYVPDYVDAYFGPAELKQDAAREEVGKGFPYQRLSHDTDQLLAQVRKSAAQTYSDSDKRRLAFLQGQLTSLRAVLDLHNGRKFTFDQEAEAVYGVTAPTHDSAYYENLLGQFDSLVPGEGDLFQRYKNLQELFVVPRPVIDTLISLCVAECRARTQRFVALPEGENCRIELVGGKSWGGYNWYLGGLQSLIQVDTSGPLYVSTLIGVAAHEGYPGHHCANIIREKNLVQDSGWVEFSVIPLFCPTSVMDEGMANYAAELVFPIEERVEFYKRILPRFLNLDTAMIEPYCRILEARKALNACHVDAARAYLDGTWDSLRTLNWLRRFDLSDEETAAKSIAFSEDYRSYRVTYTVGEQMVRDFVLRNGGTPDNPARQWELFQRLLAAPGLPADLK